MSVWLAMMCALPRQGAAHSRTMEVNGGWVGRPGTVYIDEGGSSSMYTSYAGFQADRVYDIGGEVYFRPGTEEVERKLSCREC